MFEKRKISDIRAYLNGFDRIFIQESLLGTDSASTRAVDTLVSSLTKKNCIVLSEKTIRGNVNKAHVKKLWDSGLLVVKPNNQIVTLQTTYYNAAIELSKRKHYKMLLLTNNETDGNAFVKLDYDDNHVNDLGACGVNGAGFFEYVYNPPVEYVKFTVQTDGSYDKVNVLFYKSLATTDKLIYGQSDPKTEAKKGSKGTFSLTLEKSALFESDKVQFALTKNGKMIATAKYDFYFSEEQNWKVVAFGGGVAAELVRDGGAAFNKSHPSATPTFKPTPSSTPSTGFNKPTPTPGFSKPTPTPGFNKPAPSAPTPTPAPAVNKYPAFTGSVKLPTDVKIDVVKEPDAGDVVYTKSKKKIQLVKKLGAGGEGVVFSTDISGVVCKVLNNKIGSNRTVNKKEKIEFMAQNPINNPLVVWPIDTVYDGNGKFVGFTMKSVTGLELKELVGQSQLPNGQTTTQFGIFNLTRTQIVQMIVSILETLDYLHERNVIIGDIKMENFMIVKKDVTKIYFVDCDSYQIGRFPATKVSPGYTPPELIGKKVDTIYRTFGNEYYAIFALLFMVLHKGVKPYQQIGEAAELSEEQRAGQGIFPYFLDASKTLAHAPKGYPAPNWSHLPGYVKDTFANVGNKSGKYFGESKRCNVKVWLRVFKSYLRDLQSGKLKKLDPDCDIGIHGVRATPIDYKKVDIKMAEIQTCRMSDFSLKSLIKKLFASIQHNPPATLIDTIERTLRGATEYKDNSYRFILKKNLGCYYDIEFSCKS